MAHIPLIVHFPGAQPRREPAIVQPVDLMPTLLDIAGAPSPETVQGISVAPLLRGETIATRDVAITSPTILHRGAGGCRVTLTTDPATWGREWAFICAPTAVQQGETLDRAVDGHAKLERGGLTVPSELYDLGVDPHQEHDVIAQHPDVAAKLRERLVRALREMGAAPELVEPWG